MLLLLREGNSLVFRGQSVLLWPFSLLVPAVPLGAMESAKRFEVSMHSEAAEFLAQLSEAARKKCQQTIERAQHDADIKYFKQLREGVWEFRVQNLGDHYRFFALWMGEEERSNVYITHGWHKQQKRTPDAEIARALQIREAVLGK